VILEHAILDVARGEAADYEAAVKEALPLIAATPDFIRPEIRPCLESFRDSGRYQAWKNLLHRFYSPFPLVEHFGDAVVTG
jgi:hypothetical protein